MSTCEHCGCNPRDRDRAETYLDRTTVLTEELKRQAATHAVEVAQLRLNELAHGEDRKGLQRKVSEQRRTINRLETKLRKLGVPPYAQDGETP